MQFDWFIDTVPEVIERVQQAEKRGEARGETRGEAKGKVEGELQALRRTAMHVVQTRFPALLTFAQVQINGITLPAQLDKLVLDLIQAPDEVAAIRLLSANGQRT